VEEARHVRPVLEDCRGAFERRLVEPRVAVAGLTLRRAGPLALEERDAEERGGGHLLPQQRVVVEQKAVRARHAGRDEVDALAVKRREPVHVEEPVRCGELSPRRRLCVRGLEGAQGSVVGQRSERGDGRAALGGKRAEWDLQASRGEPESPVDAGRRSDVEESRAGPVWVVELWLLAVDVEAERLGGRGEE